MSYRWNGQYDRGEMRIRRERKRNEAEERNARYQAEIAQMTRDHNISEREAKRVRAERQRVVRAKRLLRQVESVPVAA
jgi:hypothetical protein